MSRRFCPTDAFVDESIRGQRYLVGCVLIEARHVGRVRRQLDGLVLTGGRVHFHNESPQRRRDILAVIASMPVSAFVVVCHRTHGVTGFAARRLALARVVERVQASSVPRLVIESRHDDVDDRRTIGRARRPAPALVFDHRLGGDEPMLWIADAVTWAVGAGQAWRALIDPVLDTIVELRP
jgi:hypothetical protein